MQMLAQYLPHSMNACYRKGATIMHWQMGLLSVVWHEYDTLTDYRDPSSIDPDAHSYPYLVLQIKSILAFMALSDCLANIGNQ